MRRPAVFALVAVALVAGFVAGLLISPSITTTDATTTTLSVPRQLDPLTTTTTTPRTYLARRLAEADYVDHLADLFGYSSRSERLLALDHLDASLIRGRNYCRKLDIVSAGHLHGGDPDDYLRVELESDIFGVAPLGWQAREVAAAIEYLCPRHMDVITGNRAPTGIEPS